MKRSFRYICTLMVATVSFVACEEELVITPVVKNHTHFATVTIGTDSKTTVIEGVGVATYKWNDDDAQYFHVYENGTEGEITDFSLNGEKTVVTLTVGFTGSAAAELNYTAKYAKEFSGNGNPAIQALQYPKSNTFDPAADVLISKATPSVTGLNERPATLQFIMGRVVTVNKMTITGLNANELVKTVEFQLSKSFVGGNYVISSGSHSSSVRKVTLDYTKGGTEEGLEANGEGIFPVYFIASPVTDAGLESIVVTTDTNVYTKDTNCDPNPFDGKSISFAVGTMTSFTMSLGGYGDPISSGTVYTRIEDNSGLHEGAKYILVASDLNYVMGRYNGGNNHPKVDITKSNNQITIDNTILAEPVVLNKVGDNWTMKNAVAGNAYDGYYLHCAKGSSNHLKETDDDSSDLIEWSISISSGTASIVNANNEATRTKLFYNSNNNIFACYAPSSSGDIYHSVQLFVDASTIINSLETPTILAGAAGKTITVTWDDVANASSYLVTCTGQANKNIDPGVEETSFTVAEDGTYTVTVTAISDNHSSFLDSDPASEEVVVGTPALGKPVISSFTQTETGFSAEISAAIEHATSYDWDLYEGSIDVGNWVGTGSTTNLSFDVAFANIEIGAFTVGTTYYLVVTAKAAGYTNTESDPANFVATGAIIWTETSIASLTPSDIFVIVGDNGDTYALPHNNGASSKPTAVSVTVADSNITSDVDDSMKWNLEISDGKYIFHPNGNSESWLYCTNDNNGVRVGTNSNKTFTIEEGYLKNVSTSRYIGIYNSEDWRCYTSTGTNISGQSFKFYKRAIDDGKKNAGVSLSYDGTITYGSDPVQLALSNPNNVVLTCTSNDASVATVSNSGLVTVNGAGSAIITASWAEQTVMGTTYREGSVNYNLTVNKANVAITFSDPITNVAVGNTVTNLATATPNVSPITYSSSDGTKATVSSSGVVTGVALGICTITASFAGNSNYNPASGNYTITVGSSNDGSLEHPYTVEEALTIIGAYSDKQKSASQVYVSGIIANVGAYNDTYHSVTYDISDDGSNANTLNIYSGKFVANTNFSSNSQLNVNDAVIVYGYLYLFGSTKEMYQNNYIYSLNNKTKALTAGSLTATPDNANKQITVTWEAATGTTSAISYVVNCGPQSYNANAAGSHTFTMADFGTYDVTVVASAADAISVTSIETVTLTDPNSGTKDYYKLITNINDITAGTYVVGALRSESATNNFYFGKATVSSGDWVVSDSYVTVEAEEGVRRFEIANLPTGAVEFTFTGDNTNGFTIKNGSNYLYFTSNNNRKLSFAAAGSSQKWKVVAKDTPLVTGGIVLSAVGEPNYTISENSTATGAIRGYANTTKYRAIYLFKKVNE